MAWTSIAKPTTSTFSYVNPQGKEFYDDMDVTYDSATTYYDGINPNQWTSLSKPSVTGWVNISKPA